MLEKKWYRNKENDEPIAFKFRITEQLLKVSAIIGFKIIEKWIWKIEKRNLKPNCKVLKIIK